MFEWLGKLLGIGGGSTKTDRGNQLAGINAEWNIYNRGLPLADTTAQTGNEKIGTGFSTLEDSKKYYQDILSGNKTAVATAAEPAISAEQQQMDATKREQAQVGTDRGGGVNAGNQQMQQKQVSDISNIVAGLQPAAAKNLQSIGTTEAEIGTKQTQQALMELGLSQDVANEIINSSINSRPISAKANEAVKQMWSNGLAALGL